MVDMLLGFAAGVCVGVFCAIAWAAWGELEGLTV